MYSVAKQDGAIKPTTLDYKQLVNSYVKSTDWRVKENSTVTYSVGGLILSNSGAITANYWLSEIYDDEIANAHRDADIHLHDLSMLTGYCFTGDTRIKTLDGKNWSFEELVNNGVKEIQLYSYDTKNDKVVASTGVNPRVTREVCDLVKVTLSSGEVVKCTPDHPFLMRDGTYKEAKDIRPNMSLVPLYISDGGKYARLNRAWTNQAKKVYVHRWACEQKLGRPLLDSEVVHHINGDKKDNRLENLQVMPEKKHRALELRKTMLTNVWKEANKSRLLIYNQSKQKRECVSLFSRNRERDVAGRFTEFRYNNRKDFLSLFRNHRVRHVEFIHVSEGVKVYDLTVPDYHNFALDAGVFVHNCAGWSLKQLIQEGLGGVPGKITSAPAKHLVSLCNQMVNFLGIMQNEWAGAQAFSSFDTYLAPFVKADNLSYYDVKNCIQSFIYGVNTPSRWGCVDTETEILSTKGFKRYDELEEGDEVYTWNNGRLEINKVNKVIVKPFKGKLHSYKNRSYNQTVTPNHRVLVQEFNKDECVIKLSEEIFDIKTPYAFPTMFKDSELTGVRLSDAEIQMAAILYSDGSIEIRNDSLHKIKIFKSQNRHGNELIKKLCGDLKLEYTCKEVERGFSPVVEYVFYGDSARKLGDLVGNSKKDINNLFLTMSMPQAKLFIETWSRFDGNAEKLKCQYDNEQIADKLQQIALLAGFTSYKTSRNKTNYIKIRKVKAVTPTEKLEIDYDGLVWCPNVDNGTAVFRKDGNIFISGQTQAPFSNITLDWTVPNDLAELPAIVGGKEMDFCYKDCKKEMDLINRAFIETMIEGDANGRGFQYPIPTYSITRDFDWSETENNKLLFEMASKYGTPYFSNYINSDMQPSDVRSMCPLYGKQNVLVMDDYSKEFHISKVENLYKGHKKDKTYTVLFHGKGKRAKLHRFDNLEFYKVVLSNGHSVIFSGNHDNLALAGIKKTTELTENDYLLFETTETEGCGLTYEDGYMVGAFMGDGSIKDDFSVTYSLNDKSKAAVMDKVSSIGIKNYGAKISVNTNKSGTCSNVTLTSKMLRGLISDYVTGTALNKAVSPKAINRSINFRHGFIEGLTATDGNSTSGRVYTASKKAVETISSIFASLGIPTSITVDKRNTPKRFSSNPVYCIRPYNVDYKKRGYAGVFKEIDGQMWFKIASVEKITTRSHVGYCFEVVNDNEPYFMMPNGLITHNCRLRLDLRELRKKSGGFFGSGESTGSIGVVSINIPRIAYLSGNEEEFYKRLDRMMDISARSLKIKRDIITRLLNEGLYPYTKRYLNTFNNHFSTIGLVGMNEACLNANWIREDLTHEKAQDFTKKVLTHMRNRLSDYQEKYGDLYNLEATPAESTSFRLAKHDVEKYPDIITASEKSKTPYYTNSSHLPVGYTEDLFTALDIQDELQTLYTSGTVFHVFLGEKLPDWKAAANLVRKIAENYRLPYYTLSPTYSICKEHGYLAGEKFTCPECGQPAEVYSRITGYYRPVQNWNDGKAEEYRERKVYDAISSVSKDKKEEPYTYVQDAKADKIEDIAYLFTTKTCPNCRVAKSFLDEAGVKYLVIDAEENEGLVHTYNVMQAPTLVVVKNGVVSRYTNASNIKKYAEEHR